MLKVEYIPMSDIIRVTDEAGNEGSMSGELVRSMVLDPKPLDHLVAVGPGGNPHAVRLWKVRGPEEAQAFHDGTWPPFRKEAR